MEVRITA
jgi:hypothetical protein